MKKSALSLLLGICSIAMFSTSGNAQTFKRPVILNFKSDSAEKPDILGGETSSASAMSLINSKAIKHFAKEYKQATLKYWLPADHGGGVANCMIDGLKTRIYYDGYGRWAGSLTYYTDANMPRNIRTSVKREYFDFTINQAVKIEAGDKMVFYVYIEDSKSFKTLCVTDEEIKVIDNFPKQQ